MNTNEISSWRGETVVDSSGDKVGKVEEIYLDEETGQPEWLAVKTGMFGSRLSFVPIEGVTMASGGLTARWEKSQIKDAPNAEADGQLSQPEEARLYEHYGLHYSESRSDSGLPNEMGRGTSTEGEMGRDVGHDRSGPSTDSAMTRSEEELRLGKSKEQVGRVRLKKWIETEHVSQTVPVTREEARVEREPITDGNIDAAMSGPELSEEEHEMTLNEEKVSVDKEVVPKERVRLDKDVVTEQRDVNADLRKEQIDVDRDAGTADIDMSESRDQARR